ncbi:DNA polymerase I [Boudabousia tangfeifanii]|uniref:DNA polymerase I n=1 Tax=Boudabousia tangfeifanii TaxID=1912795 RepID=A0A1D9MJT7_9ACTO|nr:DNA polymerase I [Boudabousia tangfeifanii]AOZ72564.1 DNA polymerase I [Boudabousia tangfeifanii]
MGKKLLVVDGHSLAFRAFFALPAENFATATGQHTNAIYGFMSMFARMLEEEHPTHVAVAFDLARESFRNEIYPDYKGGRESTPPEFKGQVPIIEQILEAMNIQVLTKTNYEADDILATLAYKGEKEGFEVLVASGDRDSFQLITDKVTVLWPGRSTADVKYMNPQAVVDKYQVTPKRYPELAALVGEGADNIPGVPGVGPKTAAQWLNKFDGLDNLLTRADEIGGKRGEALREHTEQVKLNRQINALLTDLELDCEWEDLERGTIDRSRVEELCDTLEFNRLRYRLIALDPQGGQVSAPESKSDPLGEVEITVADSKDQISAFASALLDSPSAVTLCAGSEDSKLATVLALVLSHNNQVLVAAPHLLDEDATNELLDFLNSEQEWVYADYKATAHQIATLGWELPKPSFDVTLAAYLANSDQRDYGLDKLSAKYLKLTLEAPAKASDQPTGQATQDTLFDESALDTKAMIAPEQTETWARQAKAISLLYPILEKHLSEINGLDLLNELELPTAVELFSMEQTGVAVSQPVLKTLKADLKHLVNTAHDNAIAAIGGQEVNLSSPKQLREILFEQLDMPKTKKTKTGAYTTNAAALEELFLKTQHPFLQALLEHRDKIKLLQTVEGLEKAIATDGRIHTTFLQTVAATGRLSSADPNLQNIPARTAEGRKIRSAFVPGKAAEGLLTADYSQIEMRIMAHLCGDQALLEAFQGGEDVHRSMASAVFNVKPEEVDSEQRAKIKAMSYGLVYGLSAYGLSNQLHISVGAAAELMEMYFARFGAVRDFLEGVVAQARKDGYTETIYGRRRYLPELNSTNRQLRTIAERAALNAPIQGSAADIIKRAMLLVAKQLRAEQLSSKLLLQVHDELILEIAPGEKEAVTKLVTEAMSGAALLDVPLEVSVGYGSSWEDAAH